MTANNLLVSLPGQVPRCTSFCARAVHQVWGSSSSKIKAGNNICEVKLSPKNLFAKNYPVSGGVQPDSCPHTAGSKVDVYKAVGATGFGYMAAAGKEAEIPGEGDDSAGDGGGLNRRFIIASHTISRVKKNPQTQMLFCF